MSDLEKQASTWVPPWQRDSAKPASAEPVSNLRDAAEQAAARWSSAAVAAPSTRDTPDDPHPSPEPAAPSDAAPSDEPPADDPPADDPSGGGAGAAETRDSAAGADASAGGAKAPGAGAAAGAVKARGSVLGIRAVVDAAAAVNTLDARIGAIASPLITGDDVDDAVQAPNGWVLAQGGPADTLVAEPGVSAQPGIEGEPADDEPGDRDPAEGEPAEGEPGAAKKGRAKKERGEGAEVPEQRKARKAAAAEPEAEEEPEEPEYRQYDPAEFKAALEAILMVVDEPASELLLATIMEVREDDVAIALIQLAQAYTREGRGFDLRRAAGGWRYYTRAEYAPYVERFVLDGQQLRLTQASLETLAVVAYKQPVTRARISAIRGVNCDGVIRTLIARGMVEECGADPDSGGHLYKTTSLFLEKMGLDSVEQLPPLAPFLPDNLEELAAGE